MLLYMGNRLENYKVLIGQKIQRRRMEIGFPTQKDLAKKLGTDQPQVSRWERGQNIPQGKMKTDLAQVLKVKKDFFETVEIEGDPKSDLFFTLVTRLTALNEEKLGDILSLVPDLSAGNLQSRNVSKK